MSRTAIQTSLPVNPFYIGLPAMKCSPIFLPILLDTSKPGWKLSSLGNRQTKLLRRLIYLPQNTDPKSRVKSDLKER